MSVELNVEDTVFNAVSDFYRGLFNRTSALVPTNVLPTLPENAQGAFNLSHPSTFRVLLG